MWDTCYVCKPVDVSTDLISFFLQSSFCIRDEGCQLLIITQLMLEHQVIGILPNLVSLSTELLHGFLMYLILSLAYRQDAVDHVLDHLPHINHFVSCGLGHGTCIAFSPEIFWNCLARSVLNA